MKTIQINYYYQNKYNIFILNLFLVMKRVPHFPCRFRVLFSKRFNNVRHFFKECATTVCFLRHVIFSLSKNQGIKITKFVLPKGINSQEN